MKISQFSVILKYSFIILICFLFIFQIYRVVGFLNLDIKNRCKNIQSSEVYNANKTIKAILQKSDCSAGVYNHKVFIVLDGWKKLFSYQIFDMETELEDVHLVNFSGIYTLNIFSMHTRIYELNSFGQVINYKIITSPS